MNIAIGVGIAFAILLIIAICCMIIFYRRYVLPRFISYFFAIIFDLKIFRSDLRCQYHFINNNNNN